MYREVEVPPRNQEIHLDESECLTQLQLNIIFVVLLFTMTENDITITHFLFTRTQRTATLVQ